MCELHEKDDSLALHQSCKVKTISDLKVIEGTNTHIDEVARSVGREWDY